MDPLLAALAIALAEEGEAAGETSGAERYTTLSQHMRGAKPPIRVLDIRGCGALRELVVRSSSPGYRVVVEADGRAVVDDTYEELAKISGYSSTVTAVNDGAYTVVVKDIRFSKSLSALITGGAVIDDVVYTVVVCAEPGGRGSRDRGAG